MKPFLIFPFVIFLNLGVSRSNSRSSTLEAQTFLPHKISHHIYFLNSHTLPSILFQKFTSHNKGHSLQDRSHRWGMRVWQGIMNVLQNCLGIKFWFRAFLKPNFLIKNMYSMFHICYHILLWAVSLWSLFSSLSEISLPILNSDGTGRRKKSFISCSY